MFKKTVLVLGTIVSLVMYTALGLKTSESSGSNFFGNATYLNAECEIPPTLETASVVVVSAYEGAGMSTATLLDDGSTTLVGDIVVEEGSKPLELIISSRNDIIFRIRGAIDRIDRAIVVGDRNGIVGVEPSKVMFGRTRDCLEQGYKIDTDPKAASYRDIANLIGRKPDHVFSTYALSMLKIPSGRSFDGAELPNQLAVKRTAKAAASWRSFDRFHDGGLIDIDPQLIVSSHDAKLYGTLPGKAGLSMLVESGALVPARVIGATDSDSDSFRGRPFKDYERAPINYNPANPAYFITEEIRIPAGLSGAHRATFLLPAGTPMPLGKLGHSELIAEE